MDKKSKQDKKKVSFQPGGEETGSKEEQKAFSVIKPAMTQEEKKAQRDAKNKEKAAMKAAAAQKKQQKAQQEAEESKQPANDKKSVKF